MLEIGYQGVEPGDLAVHGMDGFAGAIGISDSRGKASPVLNIMDSTECKKYVMYYLRSLSYRDVFLSLSTGIRVRSCDLRWNKLAVLPYVVPSIAEQERIAAYLDSVCADIDSAVAEAKASMKEYKLLKQSIITQAVTKGLDPSSKTVNSGIKRIGTVPVNWNIGRMKWYISSISSGLSAITGDTSYGESGKYVLRTSAVSTGTFKPDEVKEVFMKAIDRLICPVEKDMLIMSRMNTASMVGYCAYVGDDYPNYYLPDKLWKIRTNENLLSKFAWYLLNSQVSHDWFASIATGTSQSMLNISLGDSVKVPEISEGR